jgi:CRISPR/Cas system-associated exonuclease Cas4 (RecB family)
MRNISNSEVTTFLTCKRQYNYAFMMELEPKVTSDPLSRGTIFHAAMQKYWEARLEGYDHDAAMTHAYSAFSTDLPPGTSLEVPMQAQFLWVRYMNFNRGFPTVKPLGTEQKMDLQVSPTFNMSMKYDFYFEDIPTGKKFILDYKLAYEFWKDEDHQLNAQMPKYITILQSNGFQVDGGYLEEIRTRELGKEKAADPKNLWRSTRYVPSVAKKAQVLKQHITASYQIEQFRSLSPEDRAAEILPVLNKHGACAYCNFKDLCIAELEGKTDLSVDIRVGYNANSYAAQYNERDENNGINF